MLHYKALHKVSLGLFFLTFSCGNTNGGFYSESLYLYISAPYSFSFQLQSYPLGLNAGFCSHCDICSTVPPVPKVIYPKY